MGQRTQIILAVENAKGDKKVTVFHDQWGIGRKSFLTVMDIAYALSHHSYDTAFIDIPFIIPERSNVHTVYTFTYFNGKKSAYGASPNGLKKLGFDQEFIPEFEDFLDAKKAGGFIKSNFNNNNGAVVVYIKEGNPTLKKAEMKVGWLLGLEDEYYESEYVPPRNTEAKEFGPAFSRWLNMDEYASLTKNSRYANAEFMEMFRSFAEIFKINQF